ncbi:hypothetical protein ACFLZV_06995 [Candidatus Margulisiibacteriota bacterium]
MDRKLLLAFIAISVLFLFNSCRDDMYIGRERVIEKNVDNRPGWTVSIPSQNNEYIYFRGEEIAFSSSGMKEAYQEALTKIRSFIDAQVKESYNSIGDSVGNNKAIKLKENFLEAVSQSISTNAKEKEVYWEKIEKVTSDGVEYYYRVFSLVEIPVTVLKTITGQAIDAQINQAKEKNNEQMYEELIKIEKEVKGLF